MLWFGLINAGTLVLSYLAAEVLGRALDVGNVAVAARLLFVLNALTIVGVLAFALAGSFAFALGAFWFASLTRKLFYPLYLTWVNRGLDPNVRATVISISNQANSLGELAGGPVVGAVAPSRASARPWRQPRWCSHLPSSSTEGPSDTTASSPASKPRTTQRKVTEVIKQAAKTVNWVNSYKICRSFVDEQRSGA